MIAIKKILQAFYENPKYIIIPTCQGKRGHPPIVPKTLFPAIFATPPTQSTSDIIRNHPNEIFEIEVDDERILWNINTEKI